jgi:hypothetical protein
VTLSVLPNGAATLNYALSYPLPPDLPTTTFGDPPITQTSHVYGPTGTVGTAGLTVATPAWAYRSEHKLYWIVLVNGVFNEQYGQVITDSGETLDYEPGGGLVYVPFVHIQDYPPWAALVLQGRTESSYECDENKSIGLATLTVTPPFFFNDTEHKFIRPLPGKKG